jgi:TolA-binding protein
MERLAWRELTPGYAREVGRAIADEAPASDLAGTACQQLFDLASADGKLQYGETRATFEKIASAHPASPVSDTARHLIGKLYAAEGQHEAAEEAWAALIAERPKAKEVADARAGLADVRYSLGMKAFTDRDYEKAADWLGKLLPDIAILGPRSVGVRMETIKSGMLRSDQRYVVFSYAEACEKLGRWAEAAGAYERLAMPGNPAQAVALSKLVKCYVNMGDRARARRACDELAKRFPNGPQTRAAQKLL